MPPSYECWLLNDSGRKIVLLDKPAYFSYSRTIRGYGTCLFGFPYEEFRELVFPVFQVDRRIDIWRSPEFGYPLRHEGVYFLRQYKIYRRESDNVQIVAFWGRDPKDLLRRRWVIQPAGYPQTYKTTYIDDMMKEIVREQMLYGEALDADAVSDNDRAFPQDEFSVQGNLSLGPIITHTFSDRNVLDVLKELGEASVQLHDQDPLANEKIYFDIIAYEVGGRLLYIQDEETGDPILDESGAPLLDETSFQEDTQGLQFVTFPGLRGQDRTANALVFSPENNNLEAPYYIMNHMGEENSIIVKGFGRGDSRPNVTVTDTQRAGASRWNRCEGFQDASTEPDQSSLDNYAYPPLHDKGPKEEISATFLNVPGSEDSPRSLYGLDWDLGDLLPVEFASKRFNAEVEIVYVAIDEGGRETITGRNGIDSGDQ